MSSRYLYRVYEKILTANTTKVSWLNVGDSKTTDTSSASNLGYGMQRVFRPPQWSFRVGRSVMGATPWGAGGNNISSDATVTTRNPGATFGGAGAATQINPIPVSEWVFSANRTDGSAVSFANAFLNDSANYAVGNVWASNACYVRQAHYQSTDSIASARIRSARNTGTDASPTYTTVSTQAVTLNGTNGWTFTDVSCGSGTGSPAVQVIENSINEATVGQNQLVVGPRTFVRGSIGSPLVGFGLGDIATGGHNAQDVSRVFGSSVYGTPYCTAANAAWFWANVYMNPDIVHLDITQNQSTAAGNALNAGNGTLFKEEIRTCINAINSVALLAGAAYPLFILSNGYNSAYTELNRATRSQVIDELASETNNAFIDYSVRMPNSAGTGWWTSDDIHPSADGASFWAATLWNSLVSDYQGYQEGNRKPLVRVMRRG
jgi:hypothetical protein